MTDQIKSMPVFFVDNQHMWPKGAQLHGNLVVWPDNGKYPTFTPVAISDHPQFDGKIILQAGNRGIIVSFAAGAETPEQIRAAMSDRGLEQYRVAAESIVHSLVLMRAKTEGGQEGDVSTIALLTMLAKSSPLDAGILIQALNAWMKNPAPGAPNDANVQAAMVESAEEMRDALKKGMQE